MRNLTSLLLTLISLSAFSYSELSEPGFKGRLSEPKSLFGIHQRNQIKNAEKFQYRVIGQLDNLCTGTLIGKRHVLTAAHCIYNPEKKEWSDDLNFTPGRVEPNKNPYGRYLWKRAFLPKEFIQLKPTDKEIYKYDYAIIELELEAGENLGWYGIRAIETNEISADIKITGYPIDKMIGSMWTVNCPAEIDNLVMYHKCDTFAGMSGSAIVNTRPEDTIPYIIGVLSRDNKTTNMGTIFTEETFKRVLSWVKEGKPSKETITRERPAPKFTKIYIHNNCHEKLQLALKWRDYKNKDNWNTQGFFIIEPGIVGHLVDTRYSSFYFWAQTVDKKITYKGDHQVTLRQQTLPMRAMTIKDMSFGEYTLKISCNK